MTISTRPAIPELLESDQQALLRAAREALIAHLDGEAPPEAVLGSAALEQLRATFVTLRQADTDELRGCRGEVRARQSLLESVREMVVASAVGDPRFEPVKRHEVDEITISISVLSEMRPIRAEEVEVGRHGLMIVHHGRAGLLLPSVPVACGWDRDQFLGGLCAKAGLPESTWRDPDVELLAFETVTWGEDDSA